jgi:hypothetical protein
VESLLLAVEQFLHDVKGVLNLVLHLARLHEHPLPGHHIILMGTIGVARRNAPTPGTISEIGL